MRMIPQQIFIFNTVSMYLYFDEHHDISSHSDNTSQVTE